MDGKAHQGSGRVVSGCVRHGDDVNFIDAGIRIIIHLERIDELASLNSRRLPGRYGMGFRVGVDSPVSTTFPRRISPL